MITVLTGSNSFLRDQTLQKIIDNSSVQPEKFEASDLDNSQMVDLFQGQSLFSQKRLIIIYEASKERAFWTSLKDILTKISDDTSLVLVETALDKRTATYKWLQKNARLVDHPWWKGGQTNSASGWLKDYAAKHDLDLSSELTREMVARATRLADDGKPVIDQQQLANAVLQLSLSQDQITTQSIDAVLAPSTQENIFELLAAALERDSDLVQTMINNLSQTEDGNRAMGLLVSQVTGLAGLRLAADSKVSIEQVAKDVGVHPYALGQLTGFAKKLSKSQLKVIVEALAEADLQLKRSLADPWVLIRTALIKISQN